MTPEQLAKSKTEHAEQRAVFAWCNMAERYGFDLADDPLSYIKQGYAQNHFHKPIPHLKWIHAVHNQGHGDAIRGAKARAEGVKSGVADIFWPCPMTVQMQGAHFITCAGLYIEMKRENGGYASDEQKEFAQFCKDMGYMHKLCHGWKEATRVIQDYFNGRLT